MSAKHGMRCVCAECDGAGEIVCPECGGDGGTYESIDKARIPSTVKCYDELRDLQMVAATCKRQCDELSEMMPHNADKYRAQLAGIIDDLNVSAEKISTKDAR